MHQESYLYLYINSSSTLITPPTISLLPLPPHPSDPTPHPPYPSSPSTIPICSYRSYLGSPTSRATPHHTCDLALAPHSTNSSAPALRARISSTRHSSCAAESRRSRTSTSKKQASKQAAPPPSPVHRCKREENSWQDRRAVCGN